MDLNHLIEKAIRLGSEYETRNGGTVRVNHFPVIHRVEVEITNGDAFDQIRIDTDCRKALDRFEELFETLKR